MNHQSSPAKRLGSVHISPRLGADLFLGVRSFSFPPLDGEGGAQATGGVVPQPPPFV
jgi:hypothetical protein